MLIESNSYKNSLKKVYIRTYGCQMNELDSEILLGTFKNMGFSLTGEIKNADIIVLNTCSVRERTEEKIYGHIGELKRSKNSNPDLILIIAGCLAQQKKDEIIKLFPYVDLVIGTFNKKDLSDLVKRIISKKEHLVRVLPEQNEIYEPLNIERESKIAASVSIMEGCNNFCSYCIVPYVRGREISRRKENIINEIQNLAGNEYKEIMLLGQNVNSYQDGNCDFPDLIETINDLSGIERIRFMTSHPKDISNKLIEKAAGLKKVCEHFHLPLQSGSNRILREMNRNYSMEEYIEKVDYIRKLIPHVSITSDIIVGFPGENEEDFMDTVKAIENIRFDSVFIFHYSARKGTKASELKDNVSYNEKIRRLTFLIDVQEKIMKEKNGTLNNKTLEILVEGHSKKNINQLTGRTRTYKIVIFNKKQKSEEDKLIGKLVNVKIISTGAYTLYGEIIS